MGTDGDGTQQARGERVQDFIFARELAEVYLLLDHLSGRSDKSLTAAIGDGKDDTGSDWIQKICAIGWPPKGTPVEQSAQAATLLLAKDRLNAAAKPANGASIVFTLMVAGDDDVTTAQPGVFGRLRGLLLRSTDSPPRPDKATPSNSSDGASKGDTADAAPLDPAPASLPGGGGGGVENGNGNSSGILGRYPPSRISLARLAYPGLIASAGRFKSRYNLLLLALFVFLIFTCVLSWDITAGRAILARLDAIEAAKVAIQKRIADAEVGPSPGAPGLAPVSATGSSPTPQATVSSPTPAPADSPKRYVQRYCERPSRLPPPKDAPSGQRIDQFEDATQLQICDQLAENRTNYGNAREDIADWLAPWGWLKWLSHKICGGNRCDEDVALKVNPVNQQQWAAVVVDVLGTAVLPLCYGFLGAGAAVVRNIWSKMRDSLLSPRDLTLSLGQLALGAVIGACIGLFVTPTGVGSQGVGGLTGSVTLTPSALSFIAGFSVEGVFVALESLVKRVFNLPDQKA
jgi:hypothetical protein